MFQTILVPLDGSDGSVQALKTAAGMAQTVGGSLVVLHVSPYDTLDHRGLFGGGSAYGIAPPQGVAKTKEEMREGAQTALEKLVKRHVPEGVTTTIEIRDGHPVPVILDTAGKKRASLIVLGSRGLSTTGSLLLGSVSHQVAQQAQQPVLIAKAPKKNKKSQDKKKKKKKK